MLDVRTLMIATMLANALLAIVLLYYWRTERTYPGFLLITGNQSLMAVGFLLVAFRGTIPDLLSIALGNSLIVLAIVLLYDGLVQFYEDRKISNLCYLLIPLAIGGFVLFRYGWDLPVARVLLLTVLIGPLLLITGSGSSATSGKGPACRSSSPLPVSSVPCPSCFGPLPGFFIPIQRPF